MSVTSVNFGDFQELSRAGTAPHYEYSGVSASSTSVRASRLSNDRRNLHLWGSHSNDLSMDSLRIPSGYDSSASLNMHGKKCNKIKSIPLSKKKYWKHEEYLEDDGESRRLRSEDERYRTIGNEILFNIEPLGGMKFNLERNALSSNGIESNNNGKLMFHGTEDKIQQNTFRIKSSRGSRRNRSKSSTQKEEKGTFHSKKEEVRRTLSEASKALLRANVTQQIIQQEKRGPLSNRYGLVNPIPSSCTALSSSKDALLSPRLTPPSSSTAFTKGRNLSAGRIGSLKNRDLYCDTTDCSGDEVMYVTQGGSRPPTRQKDAFPKHLLDMEFAMKSVPSSMKLRKDTIDEEQYPPECEEDQQHDEDMHAFPLRSNDVVRPPSRHRAPTENIYLDPPDEYVDVPTNDNNGQAISRARRTASQKQIHDPEKDGFMAVDESLPLPFNIKISTGDSDEEDFDEEEDAYGFEYEARSEEYGCGPEDSAEYSYALENQPMRTQQDESPFAKGSRHTAPGDIQRSSLPPSHGWQVPRNVHTGAGRALEETSPESRRRKDSFSFHDLKDFKSIDLTTSVPDQESFWCEETTKVSASTRNRDLNSGELARLTGEELQVDDLSGSSSNYNFAGSHNPETDDTEQYNEGDSPTRLQTSLGQDFLSLFAPS